MEGRNEIRCKIIALFEHTEKSQAEIANDLNISKSTVSRTISRYQQTGCYETNYQNCGPKEKFNERDLRRVKHLVVQNPRSSAKDILRDYQAGASGDESININSERTMRRVLNIAGCKVIKPCRRPFLSNAQIEKRLKWAREHQSWSEEDWQNVIFSDETILEISDNCPRYVRIVDGQPLRPEHFNKTTKHPTSVMIWACFSIHGTGRAHVVEGNMNSQMYIDEIIDGRVVQQIRDWFPSGSGIFQQDNAPAHVSKLSMQHFSRRNIQLLTWPPSSPDLNPIENLWSIIKRRVKQLPASNKQTLIANFLHIWYHDEEISDFCAKLVHSMPSRINAVIKARGTQTKY